MKIFGRVVAGILGFILLWTHFAYSAQSLSNFNLLQDVTVDRKNRGALGPVEIQKAARSFSGTKVFQKVHPNRFSIGLCEPVQALFRNRGRPGPADLCLPI